MSASFPSIMFFYAASAVAMLFALIIMPAAERAREKARKESWMIIDREFIDLADEERV